MPIREGPPAGSPCWTDLWTSDVDGSRNFYGELFGWEVEDPDPEFEGYFNFTRRGRRVAGCMGDMGGMPANNSWKIYLTSADITKTLQAAEEGGAQVGLPASPVGDLGIQSVLIDPTGATVGVWEPKVFTGFTELDEPGAPSWFELHTRDYPTAVAFYRKAFGLEANAVVDSGEMRYSTVRVPGAETELAGIMDATRFLPDGVPAHWSTYWHVEDADAAVAKVTALGGSLVTGPEDTPYGRLATVSDPAGAEFKVRRPPE